MTFDFPRRNTRLRSIVLLGIDSNLVFWCNTELVTFSCIDIQFYWGLTGVLRILKKLMGCVYLYWLLNYFFTINEKADSWTHLVIQKTIIEVGARDWVKLKLKKNVCLSALDKSRAVARNSNSDFCHANCRRNSVESADLVIKLSRLAVSFWHISFCVFYAMSRLHADRLYLIQLKTAMGVLSHIVTATRSPSSPKESVFFIPPCC